MDRSARTDESILGAEPEGDRDRRGGGAARPRRLATLGVAALLFLAAAGLRLVGIGHGLPHTPEPDTYIVVQADELVRSGLADRHRAGWKYPHLVATLVAALPVAPPEPPMAGASLEAHHRAVSWLHVRARAVAALLSALAVPATFLIALRFVSMRWAALAAGLLGTSLLHICFGAQARPHGPVSGFVMLAVLAALRWVERPTYGRAFILGLACAASVSTLHTGFSVLGAVFVAALVAWRRSGLNLGRVVTHLMIVLSLTAASGAWFYIRDAEGHGKAERQVARAKAQREAGVGAQAVDARLDEWRASEQDAHGAFELKISGHVIPLSYFSGGGFAVAWAALTQFDPVTLALALVGLLALLMHGPRRAPPAFWIVAGFAAPTFLLYGLYEKSTARFYLVLVPATCLVAMAGVRWLAGRPRFGRPLLLVAGSLAMLTVLAALQSARLRLVPDTLTQAARWIEQNADHGTSVHGTNTFALPLFGRADVLDPDSAWSRGPWDTYQWQLLHPRSRGYPGRLEQRSEPFPEPAQRLGYGLHQATTQVRFQIVLGPEREEAAFVALEAEQAEVAIVALSRFHEKSPTPAEVQRDAWLDAMARDARWQRVATIENGLPPESPAQGYQLTFMDIFRTKAYGPSVGIFRR